jgi:hypothetical protein
VVKTAAPFKKSEQVSVTTGKVTRQFQITFTVCGNEIFSSRGTAAVKVVAKNEVLVFETMQFFDLRFDDLTSHPDCINLDPPVLLDEACAGAPSPLAHYEFNPSGDLVFDTAYPFKMSTFCLSLKTTVNQFTQSQLLRIEVQGSEVVSVNHPQGLTKTGLLVYNYNTSMQIVDLSSLGFSFSSDSMYAPVTKYLLRGASSQVTMVYPLIKVDASMPLATTTF